MEFDTECVDIRECDATVFAAVVRGTGSSLSESAFSRVSHCWQN